MIGRKDGRRARGKSMHTKFVHGIVAAGCLALFAPTSFAQDGATVRPKQDIAKMDRYIKSYQDAVKYYQTGQTKLAEKELLDFLEGVGEHAGGNFMMGLVQVDLGDFEKARTSFRAAVKLDSEMVAPRGWLGAIEAALGNPQAAMEQKVALEKMKTACGATCPKAADIAQAIQRIDENVAAAAQPQPASAPS
jgi:TolA-binding protein